MKTFIVWGSSLFYLFVFTLSGCQSLEAKATDKPDQNLKRIALSYDDAPRGDGPRYSGLERTNAFIQQLEDSETGPVAMFITTRGTNSPEGQARVESYAKAGHLIANHSDTHMWASRTDTKDYIQDIDKAESKLSQFSNRRPWYRFPYLDEGGRGKAEESLEKREALRRALKERGLMSGYVTVDTYDWYLESLWKKAVRNNQTVNLWALSKLYTDMVVDAASHYDALAQKALGRQPAQIILLHENDLAASFTKDLVTALKQDGWTIISPDEAYKDPIAQQLPETRFSGMGRIAALAKDAGFSGAEVFDHWSVNEDDIAAKVEEAGVFGKAPQLLYNEK